jgi:cell wall-associated NlpC family hydrolase
MAFVPMLTAPAPPRPKPTQPLGAAPVPTRAGGIERRQRRIAGSLAVVLGAVVVAAVVSTSGALWLTGLALAVVGVCYLFAAVRVRRVTAQREMSAAFATDRVPDWDAFERGFSGLALADGVGAVQPSRPPVTGFDRELALFVGAWALGVVLTPLVVLIRLAGHDFSDPNRGGILGALVRAQAYGRSQSLKVVAAGLFATAGVTAVGAAASGMASAAPAPVSAAPAPVSAARALASTPPSNGARAVLGSDSIGPWAIPDVAGEWAHGKARARIAAHRHAVATRAATAMRTALAQVGKPYVYGAAGPDAFDCSGLVMFSWAAAGVSLPHNAAEQYDVTQHISESQLQPGDLVFYYGGGHVAMYIGNGRVVSANTSGTYVQTQSILWDGSPTGFSRVN